MNRKIWTQSELMFLAKHYPHQQSKHIAEQLGRGVRSVFQKANALGIYKSKQFHEDQVKSGRNRVLIYGKETRFKKGHHPWNKGKKAPSVGRTKETQFKSGELPYNTLHDGAITIRSSKGTS